MAGVALQGPCMTFVNIEGEFVTVGIAGMANLAGFSRFHHGPGTTRGAHIVPLVTVIAPLPLPIVPPVYRRSGAAFVAMAEETLLPFAAVHHVSPHVVDGEHGDTVILKSGVHVAGPTIQELPDVFIVNATRSIVFV